MRLIIAIMEGGIAVSSPTADKIMLRIDSESKSARGAGIGSQIDRKLLHLISTFPFPLYFYYIFISLNFCFVSLLNTLICGWVQIICARR